MGGKQREDREEEKEKEGGDKKGLIVEELNFSLS